MSKEFLSNLVHYRTYAKYLPDQLRRETKEETIARNAYMHCKKFPHLIAEIEEAYKQVFEGRVVPSMRSFQFAGEAIERRNNRMFNCFRRSTEFITDQGVKSFLDFSDGDSTTVLTDQGNWKPAIVSEHGEQFIDEIIISRGRNKQTVYATSDHEWILADGRRTTNLKIGDYLKSAPNIFPSFDYDNSLPDERLYWCYGFVYGDGTGVQDKEKNIKHTMVRLCDHDREYAYRFEEMGFNTSKPLSCGGDIFAYTGTYLKTSPNPEIDCPRLIKAFVAGYLSADGGKNGANRLNEHSETKNHYKSIQSSEENHIQFIRKCFPIAGIYIYREEDLTGQITNFGIRPKTINFHITNTPNNNLACKFKVTDIQKQLYTETVWCLEVEDDHSFCLPFGLSTGNCSFLNITEFKDFADIFYMSMSGCGVGYSVKKRHISQLPIIKDGWADVPYKIEDSAEGWADSLLELLENPYRQFDYSGIRSAGTALSTGGTASGPKALIHMEAEVRHILRKAIGRQLTSFECHRIACFIADAVVVGGVRRAALIVLFDYDDAEMLHCKAGNWWEKYPELARSNNSAVLRKDDPDFAEKAASVIQACFDGGQAEPGLVLTNDDDYGVNPCVEISIKSRGVCNLTEINIAKCFSLEEWLSAVKTATIIGTLQASYTDFKYVHPDWKKNAEEEALLGVSITGQAENQAMMSEENLSKGAEYSLQVNIEWAEKLGIRPAKRITTTKPSGTSSSWLGTTAGIHAGHDIRYVRRVRMDKFSALAKSLNKFFSDFIVDDPMNSDDIIMQIPIKMYENTLLRSKETAVQCLERMKHLYTNWISKGHVEGPNTHNTSLTINYYEHEKEAIKKWMIENKEFYYGISLIPYDGGNYRYLPYSPSPHIEIFEILEKSFNEKANYYKFENIKERKDTTNFKGELSCAGGACLLEA